MKKSIFFRIVQFTIDRSLFIIIGTVLVTVFFGFFMLRVKINPEVEGLLPESTQIEDMIQKFGISERMGEYMIITFSDENVFSIEKLQKLETVISRLSDMKEIASIIEPFSFVTFQKDGKRLKVSTMSPDGRAPKTEKELELFQSRITQDPFAERLIISEDHDTLTVLFPLTEIADYEGFMNEVDSALENAEGTYEIHMAGYPLLFNRIKVYLVRDLSRLLAFSLILILVMYYFGFRAKRATLLTFLVVTFGTVWCVGTMSLMGFTITIISIVTPPLVLTLGSSYSIHILNQYFREAAILKGSTEEDSGKRWVAEAVFSVNKTVLMAAATTVIGFMSLLATKLDATREFGIATSFGIIYAAFLSLVFLPAMLSRMKTPTDVQITQVVEGTIAKVMTWLSIIVKKYRIVILLVFIAITVGFFFSFGRLRYNTEVVSYFPKKDPAIQDIMSIAEEIGGYQQFYITFEAPEGEENYFLDKEVLQSLAEFEGLLKERKNVTKIMSFVTYLTHLNSILFNDESIPEKRSLILFISKYIKMMLAQPNPDDSMKLIANEEFTKLTMTVWVYDHEKKGLLNDEAMRNLLSDIRANKEELFTGEITMTLWGQSLDYIALADVIKRDQRVTTLLSFLFIFILTAIVFRSIRFGLLAIIPLLTGIMLNVVIMVVLGIPMDMTTTMLSIVVIGVGVDNAIHLLLRYKQQTALHTQMDVILNNTLKITGRPIVITSASIVGGFLVFCFASFKPIVYFGVLVAFALFTAAIGTLIILPAILSLLEGRKR